MPVSLVVTKKDTKKIIAKSKADITIKNPNGIDRNYLYFNEVIGSLKKGIMKPQDGFVIQDRELLGRRAKELIQNTLSHLFLKAGTDLLKKQEMVKKMKAFEARMAKIGDHDKLTRAEFAELLLEALEPASSNVILANAIGTPWLDETGSHKNAITSLRVRHQFVWKDSFAQRYFQSDKEITVGEGLYMIEQVIKN